MEFFDHVLIIEASIMWLPRIGTHLSSSVSGLITRAKTIYIAKSDKCLLWDKA